LRPVAFRPPRSLPRVPVAKAQGKVEPLSVDGFGVGELGHKLPAIQVPDLKMIEEHLLERLAKPPEHDFYLCRLVTPSTVEVQLIWEASPCRVRGERAIDSNDDIEPTRPRLPDEQDMVRRDERDRLEAPEVAKIELVNPHA